MANIENNTLLDDEVLETMNRRGLGTPATRAGIIEKLIKSGFVERQKKCLVPTAKGMNLIAVLPDEIKSPALTSDWEEKLLFVQRGELSNAEFMAGIESLVKGLVAANSAPVPEMAALFASMPNAGSNGASGGTKAGVSGKAVGNCPRCKSAVTESPKGFFCSAASCKFVLWKDSRFWSAKGKTLTAKTATSLLKNGHVSFFDLRSGKTGKDYAATIFLVDDGGKTDFKMEFINGASGKTAKITK